jgi:hypothetical protein
MVDNCIQYNTIENTMFIQFPFIEVPKDLRRIVGEPTPGTRAYRQEGTHKKCGEWFEALGEYYKGDVGLSPSGVAMFVPVSRAGVHKRIKEGKLTAFFFYITREEPTLFGAKRKAKQRPYIVVSVSECKAWAAEMKRKAGYVDEPASLMEQRKRLKPVATEDEPKTEKEAKEVLDFSEADPKDKGNRKVRYEKDAFDRENRQQDMFLLLAEAMAAMASDKKKAEFYRKRLEKGMEWDKKAKRWKWKE